MKLCFIGLTVSLVSHLSYYKYDYGYGINEKNSAMCFVISQNNIGYYSSTQV